MKKTILTFCLLLTLITGGQAIPTIASVPGQSDLPADVQAPAVRTSPLIIDHTTTNINAIPQEWIEAAKQNLHIAYGHTSHGWQISHGMSSLVAFANNGGRGLALPTDIFQTNESSNAGGSELHFFNGDGYGDGDLDHDAGYYPNWVNETQDYLGPVNTSGRGSNHPEINVIMWSWCGQVSGITQQSMIDEYLQPMSQFEVTYPGITFIYMTGHADGTGESGNLHQRNQQIRQYAIDNNKVLFDFYDFDTHDPDGNYYGDKDVNDGLYYDSGSGTKNWGLDWQATHTQGVDWYSTSCDHSQPINCNQKAYAAWWMWASLAGWNATAPEFDISATSKMFSDATPTTGDVVTYTIQIVNESGPVTNSVTMSDTIPAGLEYIPGSLTATSGAVDDSNAPNLTWTGILTPTPAITVTYAVTVTASGIQAITNTASFESPGEEPITRTATIVVDGYSVYLPIVRR